MVVRNESELLAALCLTQSQAADYLGKQRSTVNNAFALDEKREKKGEDRKPYFKYGELFTLISVALTLEPNFDKVAVKDYIVTSREGNDDFLGKDLVMSLLGDAVDIDLSQAKKIDIMLPGYMDTSEDNFVIADLFKRHIDSIRGHNVGIRILTESTSGADAITSDFRLPASACIANAAAEPYFPLLFVYEGNARVPNAYMATATQGFIAAPQYRVRASHTCFDKVFGPNSIPVPGNIASPAVAVKG